MQSTSLKNTNSHQVTETITQKSRSNFAASFFFLNSDKKRGIQAVYAFSRLADDAVDESASSSEAKEKLSYWQAVLDEIYGSPSPQPLGLRSDSGEGSSPARGEGDSSVIQELDWTIKRFSIPKKYFEELLQGVEKDLYANRYQTFEELCDYTYGVASTVGLICMKIFEVEGAEAEESAILLGRALQLTNIVRDIRTDAIRGRIYIPLKDIELFHLTELDFLKGLGSPRMDSLVYYEIGQIEAIYSKSFQLMKKLPRKPLLAAWMMGKVYYRILQEIKKNPRLPLQRKVKLSKFTKLRIILKEWIKTQLGVRG